MITIKVQKRNMETKAKALRRKGFVTANLFGKEIHGAMPLCISGKETEKLFKNCTKGSQLYLDLDGEKYDVLLKNISHDAVKHNIIDVEFQALVQGEKVHSVAEIILIGADKVADGIVEQMLGEVAYKALPCDLIDRIEIDCSKMKFGEVLKVEDLDIAKNAKIELTTHPETIVLSVSASHNTVPVEETAAEAEPAK